MYWERQHYITFIAAQGKARSKQLSNRLGRKVELEGLELVSLHHNLLQILKFQSCIRSYLPAIGSELISIQGALIMQRQICQYVTE
jgi:hypothetical protein